MTLRLVRREEAGYQDWIPDWNCLRKRIVEDITSSKSNFHPTFAVRQVMELGTTEERIDCEAAAARRKPQAVQDLPLHFLLSLDFP